MIIEKFDNKTLDLMRQEINAALNSVKVKYGLKILKMTNIGYAPDGLSFQTKVIAEVDPTVSPEATKALNATNERVSKILGFDRNIVGEKFANGRDEFIVTELKPERPKWPIVAKKAGTDSHFKFQASKNIHWINKDITYKYDF